MTRRQALIVAQGFCEGGAVFCLWFAVTLLLTGCAAPPLLPVHLTWVDQHPPDGGALWEHDHPREADRLLADTGDVLGFPLERVGYRWGAVSVRIVEYTSSDIGCRSFGKSAKHRACRPSVYAGPRPVLLAHELGHALGLEHDATRVPDDIGPGDHGNVMNARLSPSAQHLTDAQYNTAIDGLRLLVACRGPL